jgi:hypothetical protein
MTGLARRALAEFLGTAALGLGAAVLLTPRTDESA